jgi:phosphoglycolate phosphatase
MTMYDTLIFDFDGTLIDSAPGILATYTEVFTAAGLQTAVPLDQNLIGPPLVPTMAKLLGHDDPELLAKLVEDFKPRYMSTGLAKTPAYPGADAALRDLVQQGKTLFIATNKRAEPTLALLEKFGWNDHFRAVYCIDTLQPAYPDKTTMLRQLLADYAISPAQCLYIGDTHGDQIAATNCDMAFMAALWGYDHWTETETPVRCAQLSELAPKLAAA